jgi:hypothetical protein
MLKQNLFRFGFIALLLAASLVLLHSFTTPKTIEDSCCRQTCPQKKTREPGGIIWESLSRQFFSQIPIHY